MPSKMTAVADDRRSVQEPRSVRSAWIWRGFLLMSMTAAGIAIITADSNLHSFAILWGVIAAGWFAIAMWLWRMHRRYLKS